jgi:hypothetical protein
VIILAVPAVLILTGGGGGSADAGREDAVVEWDQFVAGLSDARVATWDRLAECESNGDWLAATGNGFFGGLQFTQQSWETVGGTGSPAAASRNEQIMRAESLQAEQGWTAWPNCSRQLGLT